MHQIHRSDQIQVKRLGSEFVRAVRSGDDGAAALFDRIANLPRSQSALLADAAHELCAVRATPKNAEEVYRAQVAGARLVTFCGLSFDQELLNSEFVPLLTRVPAVSAGRDSEDLLWLRMHRITALGQVADRIAEPLIDEAIRSAILHAQIRGRAMSHLFLPLAGFEESFRVKFFDRDVSLREQARELCLDSIARIFELTVDAIAEADPDSFPKVLQMLPWTTSATASLLTVLPSVNSSPTEAIESHMERILDRADWLLRRPFGFPGPYFGVEDRTRFEGLRSLISLTVGVLVARDESYRSWLDDLRLPESEGLPCLGTRFLASLKKDGAHVAMKRFSELAGLHLSSMTESNELYGQESVEATSLAWHLGGVAKGVLHKSLEVARNPSAQLFIVKALRDSDPWNDSTD